MSLKEKSINSFRNTEQKNTEHGTRNKRTQNGIKRKINDIIFSI